jgi:hypothetical protein
MDYRQWIDLFGKTTDDPKVQDSLKGAGVNLPLKLEEDDTDVRIDLKNTGITLVFTDEAFFHRRDDLAIGEGTLILTQVILMLQHSRASLYKGPLPFGLERDDSQEDLRGRFGAPARENPRFLWDEWRLDDLILSATYVKDLKSLSRVGIRLPRPS